MLKVLIESALFECDSSREKVFEMLSGLSIGDRVKIGGDRYEVVQAPDSITRLAKVAGTKGSKWYAIRVISLDPIEFGTFEMFGGGTRYAEEPRSTGEMV